MSNYITITPVRDEERFLPQLITSIARQTVPPKRWTIVDDGSSDATPTIIQDAACHYSWIQSVRLRGQRQRLPGGESALMEFLRPELLGDVDYILRVDADISFACDFAELLLKEFASDPRLGIASATLYEPHDGVWREMISPSFHTRGPTKMYSQACMAAIGGIEPCLGWDTVDEMRALMLGFNTRNFRHIRADHHRPQGTARGAARGYFYKGQAAYYSGYSPIFQLARAAYRACSNPLWSLMMSIGYIEGYVNRRPRVNDAKLIKFIRRQQRRRLLMLKTVWR